MIIKIKHSVSRHGSAMVIAASAILGTLLVAAPLSVDGPFLAMKSALAVGNGNGNGGVGNGSGRGADNGSLGGNSAGLGGFNSARADRQGLTNANENSPPGMLADKYDLLVAYRDAVAALEGDPENTDLQDAVADALADVIDALSDGSNKVLDADSIDDILTLLSDKLD